MFCSKCGSEIPEGTVICGYCGNPVNPSVNVNQQSGDGQGPYRQSVYGEPEPNYSGQASGGANPYTNSGYQTPYQGNGAPAAPMDGGAVGLAIASLVLGIAALLLVCCVSIWWLSMLCAVLGIVFAAISFGKHMGGKGMAIAGIICSAVALVAEMFLLIVGVGILATLYSLF